MSRDALVVGINTYECDRLDNLQAPAEDAEAIARLLIKYGGFTVKRLPEIVNKEDDRENYPLRIGRKTQVSLIQLEEALEQLFKPKGNSIPDTALFYFSGHGLRKARGIQEGFLATSDVDLDIGFCGLSLQWLRRLLQESPIRQQIVWLDCCYSGELLNFAEADPGDRGKGRDRCFLAASREFEAAYEENSSSYGVFTAALLKGLDPKRQEDGAVTNYTLIDFLNSTLKSAPQRYLHANSGGEIILTGTKVESAIRVNGGICPYKGLKYFDCNDEDPKYFYGRTTLTDRLLEKVRQGNCLAVLGASGSGKSSVVRAGLLYQLKLGQRLSGSDRWQIHIFRPGDRPLQQLALAFVDSEASVVERASQLAKAEESIAKGAEGLGHLVTATGRDRLVLVVDQFEEVFTLCQDKIERQRFFECILGALQRIDNHKFCLVISMRADFFGKCAEQEYAGLAAKIQEHLVTVTPMTEEELAQAIIAPAKKVGLEVERELVTEMIADVKDSPGSLPLLEYTLTELWQQRTVERLTLSAYTRLGRVKGTLQKRATQVYESLSPQEQQAAKRIFLELTQLGEGTEDTRRQVLKSDLVTAEQSEAFVDRIIQKLGELVVTSEVEKGVLPKRVAVVDIAHEALIRHWSLLRGWIEENRDKLRQKRKIEAAAQEWSDRLKTNDYLLRGKPLKEAREFQQQTGRLSLSSLAEDFIQQSIRQRRNNRLKLIGFGMIIPLALTVVFIRETRVRRAWSTVDAAKGQPNSPARIPALQELVRLGVNLHQIDLSRANLSYANLSHATLSRANFSHANLSRADLSNTDLRGGNFENANLYHAFLDGANLSGASLDSGDFLLHGREGGDPRFTGSSGTFLIRADLTSANLTSANLTSANLTSARLSSANLKEARLSSTNFTGADLSGANFLQAELFGANFSNANLSNAKFKHAIFSDANLSGADLSGADLTDAVNFSIEQIKSARNWEKAKYREDIRQKLGLSPEK